jgi:prolyl 4-hydroxylase|tara:strand:- start:49 stop:618 length:570 start_codon:yes stop_codon:yes gene_type:complete
MFKEYKLPLNSFIGGWFIPEKICDDLIKYFNKNKKMQTEGFINTNNNLSVNKKYKDSKDMNIDSNNFDKEIINYRKYLQKIINLYQKKYPEVKKLEKFGLQYFNIQQYPKKGGFKKWHNERTCNNKRVLTFMTYLTNIEKGGTEFLYQKLTTPSIKGLTLIWPVDFTHTHRSQICNEEKIITTGWFVFI